MFCPSGFKPYSFAIGSKHARSFIADSVTGTIADYVLGECGAEGSPIPARYFDRVGFGEGGVEISTNNKARRFAASRDKLVFAKRTVVMDEELEDVEFTLAMAKHLMTGATEFLNKPRVIFVGFVWEFVKKSTKERQRFSNPAAQGLAKRLLKIPLKDTEYPSEVTVRLSFHKRIDQSVLLKDQNDYVNAIITARDVPLTELWPGDDSDESEVGEIEPRRSLLSVDVQRMLDPRRPMTASLLDAHWRYCQSTMKGRTEEIFKEIGLGQEE